MTKRKFLIGSDPEMFVRTNNGIITSVAGLLGCSKDDKITLAKDVRLQEDNVLAEFDIDPQSGFEAFNDNMQRGIDLTNNVLNKLDMETAPGVSSHIFTEEEMKTFNESAFIFGCTPDFNAFTGQKNPSPTSQNKGLRTAGGHVHLGVVGALDITLQTQMMLGVLCDYFLSLPAVIMDKDTRRKELYGKASAIRYKDYGIEYRSLSNFWISDRENRKFVYDQVDKVVQQCDMSTLMALHSRLPIEKLHEIINGNNVKEADQQIKLLQVA